MVNPGGESAMLGHWRIVLRQAEEAARVGRFHEAYRWRIGPTWPTIITQFSFEAELRWT